MKIFLIGLPGSGKSTMAKQLAHALGYPFVDLDVAIEQSTGHKVSEIFQLKGEPTFRKTERDELLRWLAKPGDFVMATGGGTPCFFSNMEDINHAGISCYLDVSSQAIAKRMLNTSLAARPLFAEENETTLIPRIDQMRKERLPYYSKAALRVTGDNLTVGEVMAVLKVG